MNINCQQICEISRQKKHNRSKIFQKPLWGGYFFLNTRWYTSSSLSFSMWQHTKLAVRRSVLTASNSWSENYSTSDAYSHFQSIQQYLPHRSRVSLFKYKGKKVWTLAIAPFTWVDSWPAALYNPGSGSWLAWANGAAAHYVAIQCPR